MCVSVRAHDYGSIRYYWCRRAEEQKHRNVEEKYEIVESRESKRSDICELQCSERQKYYND